MKLEKLLNPLTYPGRSGSSDSALPQIERLPSTHDPDLFYCRVPKACTQCRREKSRCDLERPCKNCVKRNRAKECVDGCHPCRQAKKICENIRPCSACVDSGLDCLDYAASHPRVRKQQGRRKKSGREKKFQVHNLVLDIPSVSDSKNPDPRKAADGCRKSRRKKNGKCEETKPRSSCSVFSEADIDQVGSSVFLSSTMPISESDYGEVVTSTSARRPVVSAGTVTSFGNSQRSPYEYTSQHFPLPSISNFNTPSSRMDFNLYSSSRYVRNLSRSPVSSSAFADESLLLSMTTSSIRSTYMLC